MPERVTVRRWLWIRITRIWVIRRPNGDAGGGGGNGKVSPGTVLLAIVVAIALGTGGTAATTGPLSSSTSASSSSSAGRGPSGLTRQKSRQAEVRLVARGARVTSQLTDDSADCAEQSYGEVRKFFHRHPCVGLHRALYEVEDREGRAALVATAWVEMPDVRTARALHQLLDKNGSGNVTELSREQGQHRSVRYDEVAYASVRDGTVVGNAQAQPISGAGAASELESMAHDALR